MRAVVACPSESSSYNVGPFSSAPTPFSGPLMPLVDRTFIQHVVERCVSLGVTKADILVDDNEDAVRAVLGNGRRWGCEITYYRVSANRPLNTLCPIINLDPKELYLIASGYTLPSNFLAPDFSLPESETVYVDQRNGAWTGWATATGVLINILFQAGINATGAGLMLEVCSHSISHTVLTCYTPAELLDAQYTVLAGDFAGMLLTGRELQEGVRIGRSASIHPNARLIAPVYVGENSQIGAGAVIGPNSVVARDCIIDRGNIISGSLICPGTFVGEELEIRNAVVSGNYVINVDIGSSTEVTDPCLLGKLPVA